MRRAWLFAGLLLALPAQAAPLETYGQLPTLDNVSLSPDGTMLAYATEVNGKRTILITSIAEHKLLGAVGADKQKLRGLTWADNDHLLITVSTTRRATDTIGPRQEFYLTQSYSIAERRQKPLLENVGDAMNVVFGVPRRRIVDGHTKIYLEGLSFPVVKGVLTLFAVDVQSGRTDIVQTGTDNTQDWYIGDAGNLVARTQYDEHHQRWSLDVRDGLGWKEVYSSVSPIDTPDVAGIGPGGDTLILLVPENGDVKTKQYNLKTGAWETPIDLGDDMVSLVEDPLTQRVIGTQDQDIGTTYRFFGKADQAYWDSLVRAFPGENLELVSWSDDRRHVVARVDGAQNGAIYFLVDLTTHHAIPVGLVYRGIEAADVATVKRIQYAAADGRTIPAYLTLPNGKPAKGLPLIVLPHGGPASRDTPEFDWWAQALASRGYAVLQPEFRGSSGFGWDHLSAGFGQWGRKMQSDLSDGVRFLAKDGTIDAKRVCIVGASYGGYAALAGATMDHGVYRCAVSVSGVSDPRGLLAWREDRQRSSDSVAMRFTRRYMGVDDIGDPRLKEISPLAHAAGADIPILLIHGKDDTVVPIRQSEDMADALKAAGKPVTFLKLDGEDHWLSKSETRLQMLRATVSFLEANNPPN